MLEDNLYQRALNNIRHLEGHFCINMDKEAFYKGSFPAYFNIHIDNVNDDYNGNIGVIYNFEVHEGSAQIVCAYDEDEEFFYVDDWNDVLDIHIKNLKREKRKQSLNV